jgi:hypothetical protein
MEKLEVGENSRARVAAGSRRAPHTGRSSRRRLCLSQREEPPSERRALVAEGGVAFGEE